MFRFAHSRLPAAAAGTGNLDPHIWGGPGWHFLKSTLHAFNPQTQSPHALNRFVRSFTEVLPCGKCRSNFANVLKKFPFEEYNRRNMRLTWYDAVRAEVRKHEVPKTTFPPWLVASGFIGVGVVTGLLLSHVWFRNRKA